MAIFTPAQNELMLKVADGLSAKNVTFGSEQTYGQFDSHQVPWEVDQVVVNATKNTVTVATGILTLSEDSVGQSIVVNGTTYTIQDLRAIDDGGLTVIELGE